MTDVLLLRHAPTAWNESHRLQGRADPELSERGRLLAASWALPPSLGEAELLTSPLRRARETAAFFGDAQLEPRLIETDWGAWEGQRLADLRAADPEAMAAQERLGVDLLPPGGESSRQVMHRLAGLFTDLASRPRGCFFCVTHKGVIRAAMALATGWTMHDRPPLKPSDGEALRLTLDAAGRPGTHIGLVRCARASACTS